MSRRGRKGRPVNGILLLDKPGGMTSNAALQEVKRLFDANKAGHTGSLDPLATGVLPLCFGEATKFSQFLLDADKRYLATLKLGESTNTGDADGEVLEVLPVQEVSSQALECLLAEYRGEITQIPSMFSALKVGGQPLYKLARQGIEVERKERTITVHSLDVTHRSADTLQLDVRCSKGTYIRTLADDLGRDLGCGAHVVELRRLAAGPFREQETVTLDELRSLAGNRQEMESKLLPVCSAVKDWPSVELTEITTSYLRQGQPVQIANAPTTGWVSIFSESTNEGGKFVGIGEILDDGRIAPRRLVVEH